VGTVCCGAQAPVRLVKARKTYQEMLGIDPTKAPPPIFVSASASASATVVSGRRVSRFDEKVSDPSKQQRLQQLWSLEAPALHQPTPPAQQSKKQAAGSGEDSDSDPEQSSSSEEEEERDYKHATSAQAEDGAESEGSRRRRRSEQRAAQRRARAAERERVLQLFYTQSTQTSEFVVGCAGVSVGAALTVCAGWTEYITRGLSAATAVFQYVLARTTPPSADPSSAPPPPPPPPASSGSAERRARRELRAHYQQHKAEDDLFLYGGVQHEWLLTHYLHLLLTHRSAHPMSPALLREALLYALKVFPNNAHFLSLYVGLESKSQLSAQLRRYFDSVLSPPTSSAVVPSAAASSSSASAKALSSAAVAVPCAPLTPATWMFAMSSELARAGAAHRIHRLFHKALVSGSGQGGVTASTGIGSCVALWRFFLFYLLAPKQPFPVAPTPPPTPAPLPPPPNDGLTRPKPKLTPEQKKYQRELGVYEREVNALRAQVSVGKKFWFRAIHQCPWSKRLWLDGITLLRMYGDFTDTDVHDALMLMTEKELRLRCELTDSADAEEPDRQQ
jgi:hypothetical protein